MNNKLRKENGKQADYQKKYMKRHKMVCVNLDKKEDGEIIRWLDKKDNRSNAIRRALKNQMELESNTSTK